MNRLLIVPFALIIALAAACGGDDDGPTPTPSLNPGVNGSLPRHLTKVEPAQKSTVSNDDLHIGEDVATGGVCASFDFTAVEGMGDTPTDRVQMLVNQEDVTQSASWTVTASQPPTGGTMCYASPQPFPEGDQLITVNYSDATERRFTYSWQFTVLGENPL